MELYTKFLETSGVCTDTRNILKDSLFISLKGENFNGNEFAAKAIKQGAKYAIVDEKKYATEENIILVEDCFSFLQDLGNYHRNQFNIPVIGITGSNGKTSTKELIREVLATSYSVLATEGNLNNHIGVPLTLLKINQSHDIAIIEMGANKLKDIEELCIIAEPNYGLITNIGSAHLEGFKSIEGVLITKKELYDSVESSNGTLFVNNDDSVLTEVLPKGIAFASYGTKQAATVKGKLIALKPEVEFSYKVGNYSSEKIDTQIIGKYNFYNFLAALCVGEYFKVEYHKMEKAISSYIPDNNRSQVKKTENNTLIMDAYNANPTSVRSALESFAMIDNNEKLFILGDMLELGKESINLHNEIVALTSDLKLTGIFIGPIFSKCNSENNTNQFFESKAQAEDYLVESCLSKKLILLKGSRGIGLETLEKSL